jgi:hypothetical protein
MLYYFNKHCHLFTVSQIQRLVGSIGTAQDSPETRDRV